jgi:uncharacterized protein (DUF2384 family)
MAAASTARRLESQSIAELVAWARTILGLTYREVGEIAGATTRTAQRWGDRETLSIPEGAHRTRLEQLRDLRRLLGSTFADEHVALEWLHRPVPLLEDRRPIDLIRRGELEPIVEVLAGAHAGAFA